MKKFRECLLKAKGETPPCPGVREKGTGFWASSPKSFIYTALLTATAPWRLWVCRNWGSAGYKQKSTEGKACSLPPGDILQPDVVNFIHSLSMLLHCQMIGSIHITNGKQTLNSRNENCGVFILNATVVGNMELCKFMLIRMICWYIHIFWI